MKQVRTNKELHRSLQVDSRKGLMLLFLLLSVGVPKTVMFHLAGFYRKERWPCRSPLRDQWKTFMWELLREGAVSCVSTVVYCTLYSDPIRILPALHSNFTRLLHEARGTS